MSGRIDMNEVVGRANFLFVTFDCLRYDVARRALRAGWTPHLAAVLPPTGWEARETPGTFTLAAHLAFFHGFLPTPYGAGPHTRLLALAFEGSLTVGPGTYTFEGVDNVIAGFRRLGYRTFCVGGVGFFNKLTPLGRVLPDLFDESHWARPLGVTDPHSTENQVNLVLNRVAEHPADHRVFVFLNVSAIHQPNRFYLNGAVDDTIDSHAAALEYVDGHLGRLFTELRKRGPWLVIICSDHGTAYGEDGYTGHRLAHPVVWDVPYAEFILNQDV
jgi:hypothetical protein